MNIKEQVLSIGQVLELKKLGFDVRKHSSMCYLPYYNSSLYKIDGYTLDTIEKNDSFHSIPTMSIGDIIEVLPTFIEIDSSKITYKLGINNSNIQYFNNNNIFIQFKNNTQIYRLFQCLKWCIKENYLNKEF